MISRIFFLLLISNLLQACSGSVSKDGFLEEGKVDYEVKTKSLDSIPTEIEDKIYAIVKCDSILNINASSILERRSNESRYSISSYKVLVLTTDDCKNWRFDFDKNYKCTESVQLNF